MEQAVIRKQRQTGWRHGALFSRPRSSLCLQSWDHLERVLPLNPQCLTPVNVSQSPLKIDPPVARALYWDHKRGSQGEPPWSRPSF
jgi:hypothetical protein